MATKQKKVFTQKITGLTLFSFFVTLLVVGSLFCGVTRRVTENGKETSHINGILQGLSQ